jgi:hypothetical protein
MVAWENKPTADQTWDNLQTYFTGKLAAKSCFKEVALAAKKQASAEEQGETQAMMFALLQDQHKL